MPDTPAVSPPAPPKSLFERLGAAVPVAIAAVATTFAGMSTTALSQSMYWRSTAAQDQSKTNDQWTFAGFKRSRSYEAENTAAELSAIAGYPTVETSAETPEPEQVRKVKAWMASGETTPVAPPIDDETIASVLQAIHYRKPEPEVLALARAVNREELERILNAAFAESLALEDAWGAESGRARTRIAAARKALAAASGPARADAAAALTAAQAVQYDIDRRRYRAESTMNQWVGFLTEVRVKTSTATSDGYLRRSYGLFAAMLIAQVGAVAASLGLSRNSDWLTAAAVLLGVGACGYGGYVFLLL